MLLLHDDNGTRVATFGEFEERYRNAAREGGDAEKALGVFANPLFDFTSRDRPVYLRVLAIQAVLLRAMYRTGTRATSTFSPQDVCDWLVLDEDLYSLFGDARGEPVDVLRRICTDYLETRVLPAFATPRLAPDIHRRES
jgi:hypothetical protein